MVGGPGGFNAVQTLQDVVVVGIRHLAPAAAKIGGAINAAAAAFRVLSIAINAISLTSQGISLAISVKQPYYDSPEAAAIGWGKAYNNESLKRKKEFHAFIYKIKVKGKTYYSYTTTIQGGAKTVKFKEIDKRYKMDLPDGAEYEYTIHSHGNDSWGANDDENFSQKPGKTPSGLPDGDVQVYEYYGLKGGFLTTPRGMVKVSRNDEGRQLDICDCLDNDPEIQNPRKRSNKIYFDNFRSENLRGSPNKNLTPTFFSQEQINKMIK